MSNGDVDGGKERDEQKAHARARSESDELKKHLDEMLDEALRGTFPASDPIALDPAR